ncbi:uncharacterized protein [Dysidea avara]|uniref:uncharacterized protein n=1 Tax=Dysidea avara TaxID=196820 RepID=UPI003316ECE1
MPGCSYHYIASCRTEKFENHYHQSTCTYIRILRSRGTRRMDKVRRQRLEGAYGQAMAALRDARTGSIAVEQRHNFGGKRRSGAAAALRQAKRPKLSTWTHKYYCLAETDEDRVPSSSLRKNELVLAGLGERSVTISDVKCTPQEFQEALLTEFPKLRQGGGFELLKCAASTWQLELIPFKISNSLRLLKSWIGTARIYIRPIQLNLDLTPTEEVEEEVQSIRQKCLQCQELIPIAELREHLEVCRPRESEESSENGDSYRDPWSPPPGPINLDSDTESEHEDLEVLGQDSVVGAVSDDSAMAVAQPVDVSPDQDQDPQLTGDNAHPLLSVIGQLTQMMSDEDFTLRIRRSSVLEDALLSVRRRTFSPYKKLTKAVTYCEKGYGLQEAKL